MVERTIQDFVITVGDDMDAELETYKLFAIVGDVRPKNRNVSLPLQARDVNVRRAGGWYFLNLLLGRKPVVGSIELDKKREVSVGEDLFIQIKTGKPSVFLAFPDTYDKLPKGFKDNEAMALLWKMFFQMRDSRRELEDTMKESGWQQREIQDRLSQSQTMLNDFMFKQFQSFQAVMEKQVKTGAPPEAQKDDGKKQPGFY